MKHHLQTLLQQSVDAVLADAAVPPLPHQDILLESPRNPAHGDFSTNIALVLARQLNMAPRDLANAIVEKLNTNELLERVETAGPGFINLHIATSAFMAVIGEVIASGRNYGRSNRGNGARVQVEFVSANPTGPLHVGHGRGAAYGAVLANVLAATGYRVEKEYYVNDAGRQMDTLAVSVLLRYLQASGVSVVLPENAYQGDYIIALAEALRKRDGERYSCNVERPAATAEGDAETALDELIEHTKSILGPARYASLHRFARDEILDGIKQDLAQFGVEFDNWFSESSLADEALIETILATLTANGNIYTENGAQWFRSTAYGDEKDRVVVRDNGNATYFASDIAYHQNKYIRGYDHLVNIWGADHHGYITRVKAAIAAMGHKPEQLEVILVQFAVLYRHGEKVAMSTRSGQFVTLAELVEEVGRDAARFFYITRRSDQHLDFDLDLAKSASNENPVYYVQYAHARIHSILNQARDKGYSTDVTAGLAALHHLKDDKEKQLATQLLRYPGVIDTAGANREPHLITTYLRELAADFHAYYNGCRIITDDGEQRNARLALVTAIKQVLANGLELLGVSAPEAM